MPHYTPTPHGFGEYSAQTSSSSCLAAAGSLEGFNIFLGAQHCNGPPPPPPNSHHEPRHDLATDHELPPSSSTSIHHPSTAQHVVRRPNPNNHRPERGSVAPPSPPPSACSPLGGTRRPPTDHRPLQEPTPLRARAKSSPTSTPVSLFKQRSSRPSGPMAATC